MASKLAGAKPHFVDSHQAYADFWAVFYLSTGLNLHEVITWKPAAVTRFVSASVNKIAVLRKQRAYDSSDGLAVWLHTARAVTEPRIAPAVRDIWHALAKAGPNAAGMAEDLVQEAGLQGDHRFRVPKGFEAA